MWVRSLGWEDLLEKETAIHSSTLASEIPWMEEPGLQTAGSQKSWTRLSEQLNHNNSIETSVYLGY